MQLVDPVHIFQKKQARPLRRYAQSVHVDILLRIAVVGPDPQQVALVARYIHQLILLEKSPDRRIVLALLLARLNRKGHIVRAVETETQHDMRDGISHPVHGDQVN